MTTVIAKQTERQALQAKMKALKARMQHDYRDAKEQVHQAADWKFYVSQYPLLSLGGIAIASYAMVPALARTSPGPVYLSSPNRHIEPSSSQPTIASSLFAFVTRTASTVVMGAAARWATEFVNKRIAELIRKPATQSCDLSRDGRHESHD